MPFACFLSFSHLLLLSELISMMNLVVKLDPNDVSLHLKRIEHVEKYGTRKLYLNSLQALLMALHPSKNSEQKTLYLEKYRILIQVSPRHRTNLVNDNEWFVWQAILATERKDTELQTLFYKGLSDLGTDFPSECQVWSFENCILVRSNF